jgi:CheY-like chemotaxis protein
LLVAGSADERQMYAAWFQRAGLPTLQASNARDGFRIAAELKPDVVVTDLELPGAINGLALITCLRHTTPTQKTAIVALIGAAAQGQALAVRAGCDRFLIKPCRPEDFAQTIDELLPAHRTGRM